MTRRNFVGAIAALFAAHKAAAADPKSAPSAQGAVPKLELSEDEWRKRLTPEQFAVLRQEATERPGSSPFNSEHRKGTFVCAGCDLPLFESSTKFESGTGWPSFYTFIPAHLQTRTDFKLILPRTEYHCARCGGRQH
jgi:peptide-methionine (R)-S-oxide reductase